MVECPDRGRVQLVSSKERQRRILIHPALTNAISATAYGADGI